MRRVDVPAPFPRAIPEGQARLLAFVQGLPASRSKIDDVQAREALGWITEWIKTLEIAKEWWLSHVAGHMVRNKALLALVKAINISASLRNDAEIGGANNGVGRVSAKVQYHRAIIGS